MTVHRICHADTFSSLPPTHPVCSQVESLSRDGYDRAPEKDKGGGVIWVCFCM